MELTSLIIAIISAVISLGSAYAAWRAIRPRPKLHGSITTAWQIPANTGELLIAIHVALTNMSSHSIHLMGYELEVKIGHEWHRTEILRGFEATLPTMRVGPWICELGVEHLLDWPPKPINHGAPLMGFLIFVLPASGAGAEIKEYRLIVTDVFGSRDAFKKTKQDIEAYAADPKPFSMIDAFGHAGVPMRRIEDEG
ncbi:hypothetical protein ACFV80_15440 [Streptomyces sp. NPDC059862]|uniref:hypothetical protein n=1 Tax=Streptomyces sp. NPDC059862 TaxID=3346975 RepID=UPI00366A221A